MGDGVEARTDKKLNSEDCFKKETETVGSFIYFISIYFSLSRTLITWRHQSYLSISDTSQNR